MATVLRAARLLIDSSSALIEDGLVIINDGRITKAGSYRNLNGLVAISQEVRDLGNVTLMPGLFDCHVHITLDPSKANTTTASSSLTDEETTALMVSNCSKLLDAGITTARDLGSKDLLGVKIRDLINCGSLPGPRLQVAHAPLTVPGGHAHAMGGVAQGVEGVRAEVRKRAKEGADLIKVMSTGGFMTAGSHPSQARYTVEELQAVKDEAGKWGMKVTTHATGTQGIERAVDARLDSIEHCAWINGESTKFEQSIAQKMVEYDIAVCPTMNTACVEHNYFCPWDSRQAIVSNLTSLRQAGVKMIVGTDAGIPLCHFERYADGLTVLADAGYTNREIIASATDIAAGVCGLTNETGKLHSGMAADLVAFDGNPLEDIHAFGKPAFVMARGKEHKLTPIAPVADGATAAAKEIAERLRKGAGLPAEFRDPSISV